MKYLVIALALQATLMTGYSQKSILTSGEYLKKSKHQKTNGIVFLTTGNAMLIAGTILASTASQGSKGLGNRVGGALLLVGGVTLDLVSIPFFVAASNNRKRATAVSFKTESYQPYFSVATKLRSYPAVSFRLQL